MNRFVATPMRTLTLVSFLLVLMTMGVTGYGLTGFFRQAMLEREAIIIADLGQAAVTRELSLDEFDQFTGEEARLHLDRAFSGLRDLSEVVQIKVFNRAGTLVWSDEATLIGTQARRGGEVERALEGATSTIFYADAHAKGFCDQPVVEFYVPLRLAGDEDQETVAAVMAIYRSATNLNRLIERGVLLVWAAVSIGGLLLYIALFGLFRAVIRRQREAESQLSKLSSEHERIVQMEKLSAVGTMVGEIAHQINNPLVGVLNLAQLAERQPGNPEPTRALLADIRRAGEHCSTFVRRMLDFTRLPRAERQRTVLQDVVRETIELVRQASADSPSVKLDMPVEPVVVLADPVLIRHAIFNLLQNATQMSPANMPVEVSLTAEAVTGTKPAAWRVSVRDHGPGIDPAAREKLFAPFFSTRPDGIGLGLSVCEHIVMMHGGHIVAANDPGGGAVFSLLLPASLEQADEPTDTDRR